MAQAYTTSPLSLHNTAVPAASASVFARAASARASSAAAKSPLQRSVSSGMPRSEGYEEHANYVCCITSLYMESLSIIDVQGLYLRWLR